MVQTRFPLSYETPRIEVWDFCPQGTLCQSGGTDDLIRDDNVDWFNG